MGSDFFVYIAQGAAITIAVTLIALPFGLIIGLGLALVYTYAGKWPRRFASIYSLVMRGIPPIVLLFILFFVLSGDWINLTPFWAGSFSLGIVSSAYQMEILRGALASVGSGQMTAARSVGCPAGKPSVTSSSRRPSAWPSHPGPMKFPSFSRIPRSFMRWV